MNNLNQNYNNLVNPTNMNNNNNENSQTTISKNIKDIVYGGLDGVITTFAIVAGATGASLSSSVVLTLGFANLLADGFSMAVGNYLGTKAELEVMKREIRNNQLLIDQNPYQQIQKVKEIYQKKGFEGNNLEMVVNVIISNKEIWRDTIVANELGSDPQIDENSPIRAAITTFIAFFIVGMVPLSIYIIAIIYPAVLKTAFQSTILLTLFTIFSMGVIKSKYTGVNTAKSGIEMLCIGGAAAAVAYYVGYFLREFKFEEI